MRKYIDAWYAKAGAGSETVYWFLAGEKPGINQIILRGMYRNRAAILDNIFNSNALLRAKK